jgi:2-amino-4-hydroxy-6-hydroxymethyldihydropteridine diphosphokinase
VEATTTHRTRTYIGLGANLGDAAGTLAAAIAALGALPGVRLRGISRLYATAPVGVIGQPEFRNAVVALDVPSGPDPTTGAMALLVALKRLEVAFGRQARERWGPRELDLDLLVFGRARSAVERPPMGRSIDAPVDPSKAARLLEVPHREAHERLFVLAPLADLAPGLVPPGWGETVATALARRTAIEGVAAARPIARWDERSGAWVSDPERDGSSRRSAGSGRSGSPPAPGARRGRSSGGHSA